MANIELKVDWGATNYVTGEIMSKFLLKCVKRWEIISATHFTLHCIGFVCDISI